VTTVLKLDNVVAGYGSMEVLHGISLEVNEGEIVSLIGANGAGKTTTLNAISGLVKVRSGNIIMRGSDVTKVGPTEIVRRGLIQSPEGRKLFSEMTVRENLDMGAYLRNDAAWIEKDMQHCFELFPILKERESQKAGSLSGGEQQMCAIARALMARPQILLLDEPSLGLAPLIVQQIFDVVRNLNGEGTTVFLVEQNANAALKLSHRGYVMETGTITMGGAADELLNDPRVREAYLGH
jgi:branched-chain amino acid transport system ATP-binding protein